jgi:hypothetical protein
MSFFSINYLSFGEKGSRARFADCNPGYRVIFFHFLRKIFIFPALITPKLQNSLVPHSNSCNFLAAFAGKNKKILRDVTENNPISLEF